MAKPKPGKGPPKKPGLVRRLVKRVQRKVRVKRGKKGLTQIGIEMRYDTARKKAMEEFGKRFTDQFPTKRLKGPKGTNFIVGLSKSKYESLLSVAITTNVSGVRLPTAEAKLGFEKEAVVIEALQGNKGMKAELERFRQSKDNPQRMPGLNFLVATIEARAKEKGFKEIKIRVPESLHYYYFPAGEASITPKENRRRMETIYERVAKTMGYKRKGLFFVKRF